MHNFRTREGRQTEVANVANSFRLALSIAIGYLSIWDFYYFFKKRKEFLKTRFFFLTRPNFEVKNLTKKLKKKKHLRRHKWTFFLDIINLKEPVQQLMRSKLAILNGFRPSCNWRPHRRTLGLSLSPPFFCSSTSLARISFLLFFAKTTLLYSMWRTTSLLPFPWGVKLFRTFGQHPLPPLI